MVSTNVSLEEQFHFDTHGYILLRGVLSQADVARYLAAVQTLEQGTYDDSWRQRPPINGSGQPVLVADDVQRRLNGLPRISDAFDALIAQPTVTARLRAFMDHPQLVATWAISKDKGTPWGGWHAGVDPRGYHFRNGRISTRMLNTVYFLTDNGPDDGCMCVVPGSHKANITLSGGDYRSRMMPGGMRVTANAGDVLLFTESLLHNGTDKTTDGTRTNLYFNYIDATYNPVMRSLIEGNLGGVHHCLFPPDVRARFDADTLAMTQWMEWMRELPNAAGD